MMWYCKAAEQGDPEMQNRLGWIYEHGDEENGIPENKEEAVKWYRKAADQNDAYGQIHLGRAYQYGSGVEKNIETAIMWYKKAAEQGDTSAQRCLGEIYYNRSYEREDISKRKEDIGEAIKWFQKVADEGWAIGYVGLAECYSTDVVYNSEERLKWYRKAAKVGNKQAEYQMGIFYEEHEQTELALEWFHKVLNHNTNDYDPNSEYTLGHDSVFFPERSAKFHIADLEKTKKMEKKTGASVAAASVALGGLAIVAKILFGGR